MSLAKLIYFVGRKLTSIPNWHWKMFTELIPGDPWLKWKLDLPGLWLSGMDGRKSLRQQTTATALKIQDLLVWNWDLHWIIKCWVVCWLKLISSQARNCFCVRIFRLSLSHPASNQHLHLCLLRMHFLLIPYPLNLQSNTVLLGQFGHINF